MIHGLQLVNIGCHAQTSLTFGQLTAIVGQNGTGKTTILKSLEAIEKITVLDRYEVSVPGLFRRGHAALEAKSFLTARFRVSVTDYEASMGLRSVDTAKRYRVTSSEDKNTRMFSSELRLEDNLIEFDQPDSSWLSLFNESTWSDTELILDHGNGYEICDKTDSNEWRTWLGELGPYRFSDRNTYGELGYKRCHIGKCRYLKIFLNALRAPSYSPEISPSLNTEGSNLASVLADLMAADRPRFNDILKAVQSVVPTILDIRATRCPVTLNEPSSVTVNKREIPYYEERTVVGHQLRFDTSTGHDLPASSISDGTLYVLALATVLVTSGEVSLILIDDVESGLHPQAQRSLIQQIKELQKQHGGLQIILTTHSPYVIDELDADQVWLLHQQAEEGVAARKLSDHPRAKEALEVLTTGEFWTSEGESWVSEAAEVTQS